MDGFPPNYTVPSSYADFVTISHIGQIRSLIDHLDPDQSQIMVICADIFPTGDLCAQITRDIFPTGDLCARVAQITRDIFPSGDLCAQVTCVPQITS